MPLITSIYNYNALFCLAFIHDRDIFRENNHTTMTPVPTHELMLASGNSILMKLPLGWQKVEFWLSRFGWFPSVYIHILFKSFKVNAKLVCYLTVQCCWFFYLSRLETYPVSTHFLPHQAKVPWCYSSKWRNTLRVVGFETYATRRRMTAYVSMLLSIL